MVVVATEKDNLMIEERDPWLYPWRFFIIFVAVYDYFHVTFVIGFQPYYSLTYQIEINDYIIMCIYLVDILIKLRTTIGNVKNPKKVAKMRLKEFTFFLDIIAFIPFSKIFWAASTMDQRNFVSIIRIVKLYVLAIFSSLIQKLNVSKASKAFIKIGFLVFILVKLIHIQACIFFYVAKIERVWVPNMDFIYRGTNIYESPVNKQYWVSIYYSAMIFSNSDMVASTALELALASIMLIACLLVVALVFTQMAGFVSQMTEKDQKFATQMDLVNTAISNLSLSADLKRKIAFYMVQIQNAQNEQEEFSQFMEEIQPSLKKKIQEEVFLQTLQSNELIKLMHQSGPETEKMIKYMVKYVEVSIQAPESEIIQQGSEDCSHMYFVQRGICYVNINDKVGLDVGLKRVRILYPGDHFGVSSISRLSVFVGSGLGLQLQTHGFGGGWQLLHHRPAGSSRLQDALHALPQAAQGDEGTDLRLRRRDQSLHGRELKKDRLHREHGHRRLPRDTVQLQAGVL